MDPGVFTNLFMFYVHKILGRGLANTFSRSELESKSCRRLDLQYIIKYNIKII